MEGPRLCPCGKVCKTSTVSSVQRTVAVCSLTYSDSAAAVSLTCAYLLGVDLASMRQLQIQSLLLNTLNCSVNSLSRTFHWLVQTVMVEQRISQASCSSSADIALFM